MSDAEERENILADAEKLIKSRSYSGDARFYLKFMENIVRGGEAFVERELDRLDGMLKKKNQMDVKKVDSFYIRRNILSSFDL